MHYVLLQKGGYNIRGIHGRDEERLSSRFISKERKPQVGACDLLKLHTALTKF